VAFSAGGDGDGRPFPADATAARSLALGDQAIRGQ